MNEAQQIVKNLFDNVGLEMNSQNTYYLFDDGVNLEFETEAPVVTWKDLKTKPEAYKAYQDEKDAMYTKVEGLITRIAQGGSEGDEEYCYGVIKIGDTYIKAEWSDYSYNGCSYDHIINTLRVVTPKQKVITFYE